MKVFDVNLRQSYYSQEVLAESMRLADIVKLNDEELPMIMRLGEFPHKDALSSARRLLNAYDLKVGVHSREAVTGACWCRAEIPASILDFESG